MPTMMLNLGGGSDCDGHDHGYDVYITKAVLTVVVAWQ